MTAINENVDRMQPDTDAQRDRLIRHRLLVRARWEADAFTHAIRSSALRFGDGVETGGAAGREAGTGVADGAERNSGPLPWPRTRLPEAVLQWHPAAHRRH